MQFSHLRLASAICRMVRPGGVRQASLTHLLVVCLDPIRIESVAPERTVAAISHVVSPAIDAVSTVGARIAHRSGGNRGLSPQISLTTPGKDTMVFLAVRALAGSTLDQGSATC
jgi:hypothetical protein